jgi:hypothetical protein
VTTEPEYFRITLCMDRPEYAFVEARLILELDDAFELFRMVAKSQKKQPHTQGDAP